MTAPAPTPTPPPVPAVIWPVVFGGVGAYVVSCALDPFALAAKLDPQTTWIAAKLNGTDTGGDIEIAHCLGVWRALGFRVGGAIDAQGPPADDVGAWAKWHVGAGLDFVIYDVESAYKSDEGGHREWAEQLVTAHQRAALVPVPAAVTSYGGYKTSIDFAAFARSGWPIFAQVYDAFKPGDETSYYVSEGGVYPGQSAEAPLKTGVHRLTRSLALGVGEAVYRPESIDP